MKVNKTHITSLTIGIDNNGYSNVYKNLSTYTGGSMTSYQSHVRAENIKTPFYIKVLVFLLDKWITKTGSKADEKRIKESLDAKENFLKFKHIRNPNYNLVAEKIC